MKTIKEQFTKTCDHLDLCAEKYKNDKDFHEEIDNNSINILEECSIDIGGKEDIVKVNDESTLYFIIVENPNVALCDDDDLQNFVGAKDGEWSNLAYKDAQARINVGLVAFFFGALGVAGSIRADRPEYFYENSLILKSPDDYYAEYPNSPR